MRVARLATVLVTLAVVAVGGAVGIACGATKPVVKLTVTYDAGPDAMAKTATLRCTAKTRATGFLHAAAARACRVARAQATFLAARPARDRVCTLIYGGPQTGRIRGTIGARKVDRRFSRTDGCQIADWTRAQGLLPKTSGAAAP